MAGCKLTFKFFVVLVALTGLVVAVGCGNSTEKQALSEFLKQYNQEVDEYSKADANKKAEIESKLDGYRSKWSDMKMDMGGHITPQALNELDKEFENISKKYASLNHKS